MEPSVNPERLSLAGIAQRCADESERFFRRQSYDPRYCYELFRRAILQRNQRAWELVYDQYRALVTGWIHRHPGFTPSGEEAEFFINRAFERLWVHLTAEKFAHFSELKAILGYLQTCVWSVVVDHDRARKQKELESWDELEETQSIISAGPPIETEVLDQVHRQQLWQLLEARLQDERERQVMYGSFVLDMKPRELHAAYRHLFPDVDAVYRVKQNVLDRLRRDPEIREFWFNA